MNGEELEYYDYVTVEWDDDHTDPGGFAGSYSGSFGDYSISMTEVESTDEVIGYASHFAEDQTVEFSVDFSQEEVESIGEGRFTSEDEEEEETPDYNTFAVR